MKICFKNEGKLKMFPEEQQVRERPYHQQTFSVSPAEKILKLWETTLSGKSDDKEGQGATELENMRVTALREKGVHAGGGQTSQQEWKGQAESGLRGWSREKNR